MTLKIQQLQYQLSPVHVTLTLVSINDTAIKHTYIYTYIFLQHIVTVQDAVHAVGVKVNVVVADTVEIRKNLVDQEDGSKLALKGNVTI